MLDDAVLILAGIATIGISVWWSLRVANKTYYFAPRALVVIACGLIGILIATICMNVLRAIEPVFYYFDRDEFGNIITLYFFVGALPSFLVMGKDDIGEE